MIGAPAPARPPGERRHVLLLILFPVAVQAAVVARFAESMLAWDEFHYAHLLRAIGEGRPWLGWIVTQHNEHRIVWTKLVLLAHAPFTSWNPVAEMYVSALLVGVIALGIWKLYRRAGDEPARYFWPVALLLCSLAQFMNMLYGLMTCHYFTVAGMVWSLVFLTRATWPGLLGAIGAAAVAMSSTLNGVVIWPAGLAVLWLERRARAHRLAWVLVAAAAAVAYFVRYQTPGQNPPLVWSLHAAGQIAIATVMSLGSPLSARSMPWSVGLGLLTLAFIAASWAGVVALRRQAAHAGLIGLALVALGTAAAIGLARHRFGLPFVLESKYVTYTTLALIAPYLSLVCQRGHPLRTPLLGGYLVVVGAGLVVANLAGLATIPAWAKHLRLHRYLVQTIDRQPDETAAAVYKLGEVRDIAAYLRAARLGPFREPVDALLAVRGRESQATPEIAAGSEVRARLPCPVDTLSDVAVIVTFTPGAPGVLHVAVHADGLTVARHAISLKQLSPWGWVPISLPAPVRACREKVLEVRVWTEGAAPGSAVRALTFPVYYGGITRHGARVLKHRDLGLAFNGVANRLLP